MSENARAIGEALNLYGFAVDSRQWHLFDDIFTDDIEADYGPGQRWTGRDAFAHAFADLHAGYRHTEHLVLNPAVRVHGDTARSIVYCLWRLDSEGEPAGTSLRGLAWFNDDLVRTPAGWRIRKRACRIARVEAHTLDKGSGAGGLAVVRLCDSPADVAWLAHP